jgi:hypothetical protein
MMARTPSSGEMSTWLLPGIVVRRVRAPPATGIE